MLHELAKMAQEGYADLVRRPAPQSPARQEPAQTLFAASKQDMFAAPGRPSRPVANPGRFNAFQSP